MRFNPRSIRFRLTAWYALILSAALCMLSLLVWFLMSQRLENDVRRGLEEEAANFDAYVHFELREIPRVDLMEEIEDFSHALPSSSYLNFTPVNGGRGFHHAASTRSTHPHYEVLTRTLILEGQPWRLEIGASRSEMHRALELLQTLLISLVPLVIVLSCLGGLWMSRRALKPVDEITIAAKTISIENLASRLPGPGTGDELERLVDAWNATLARLESAVASLSRFAADASHELRTPVAVVRTSAELALRRERAPEAYRDALREIAAESERMTQLVEDLLFLARRDARGEGMALEPVDLREIISGAAHELHPLSDALGIRIRVVPSLADASIAGNAAALRRLFLALLDNALKYSARGTEVTVTVEGRDEKVFARVADQGIGIAPEDLPHIFERFYRANKSRTGAGYGLGLSLAQSIAAAHNASIEVRSKPGQGSAFEVFFSHRVASLKGAVAS
ncbi:MAG TPA: ATP-binding protein [Bryobacteraceae bacterium]|nr:ATP-binding protein [Bryobacteraceae bacterium]